MKRTANRHLSDNLKSELSRAKHAQLRVEPYGITPETMASMIAKGQVTRERACDGKKRYRTYPYTEEVRAHLEAKYGKQYVSYACPYCNGWHLATEHDLARDNAKATVPSTRCAKCSTVLIGEGLEAHVCARTA